MPWDIKLNIYIQKKEFAGHNLASHGFFLSKNAEKTRRDTKVYN